VQVSSTSAHYVYALDIASSTLANKVSPVEISGGAFISANALQRAGLLGLSGSGGGAFTTIYVAFARTGSSAANHRGWVFSYRAPDLAPLSFYCVTCGASPANGGGIWQGGVGPTPWGYPNSNRGAGRSQTRAWAGGREWRGGRGGGGRSPKKWTF